MTEANYPGSKSGSGVYQYIINRIPPHEIYIEGFLGGGSILRFKKPAKINIGIDRDHELIDRWTIKPEYRFNREDNNKFFFFTGDYLRFDLARIANFDYAAEQVFIYLDPPYLRSTRRSADPLYKFEMTDQQHEQLLDQIKNRREAIMISGYYSDLYARQLADWRMETFTSMTRSGEAAQEVIWMNYPKPNKLHDYSFLGDTFTQRQIIKRKLDRWERRIRTLPKLHREALLERLDDIAKSD